MTGDAKRTHKLVVPVIGIGTVALCLLAVGLSVRAAAGVNRTPLSAAPQPVTVEPARSEAYRDSRTYVGAVDAWIEANVGPQYISAYVTSVLVRPGAVVHKNDVLATLDCTVPHATSRAVEMRTEAVGARQRAVADEAARMATLLDGGFIARNDVEQKSALSAAQESEVRAWQADFARAALDVRDCILRAPFDGDIATRTFDPGAFVHPGASIVSVVDRHTVRVVVDAPEKDFDLLGPGTVVGLEFLAIEAKLSAPISRRAPKANPGTRTVRFEVDVEDPKRRYPVGTTARIHVEVGTPVPATAVPIYAATQTSGKASLFVVEGDVAHARTLPVLGETGGDLYFTPNLLPPDARVVVEGRELLTDGARVKAQLGTDVPEGDAGAPRGGGFGRPL